MNQHYYVERHAWPDTTSKSASARSDCEAVMARIYGENPSHWPCGLSVGHCDGGCYLIREASAGDPIGFVGWQQRKEGLRKVGYYAIGVLPEWRGMGVAREAVSRILAAKSAGVDEVRALIVPGNRPSEGLAARLGVTVEPFVAKAAALDAGRSPMWPTASDVIMNDAWGGNDPVSGHPAPQGPGHRFLNYLGDQVRNSVPLNAVLGLYRSYIRNLTNGRFMGGVGQGADGAPIPDRWGNRQNRVLAAPEFLPGRG